MRCGRLGSISKRIGPFSPQRASYHVAGIHGLALGLERSGATGSQYVLMRHSKLAAWKWFYVRSTSNFESFQVLCLIAAWQDVHLYLSSFASVKDLSSLKVYICATTVFIVDSSFKRTVVIIPLRKIYMWQHYTMIVTLGLRIAQLLVSAALLAVSAILIKGYGPGHAPALIGYGSACGGAALIIAAIGIVAIFIDKLQGIIMLGLDGFATFFLLAGAAAYAAKVKAGDCTNGFYLGDIQSTVLPSLRKAYHSESDAKDDIISRCRMAQADSALLWILVVCFAGTIVLAFFGKSGKRGGSIV